MGGICDFGQNGRPPPQKKKIYGIYGSLNHTVGNAIGYEWLELQFYDKGGHFKQMSDGPIYSMLFCFISPSMCQMVRIGDVGCHARLAGRQSPLPPHTQCTA